MRNIFLLSFFLVLFNNSFACSCGTLISFCYCHSNYDLSASCIVVGTFPHGISLKVLHVLKGTENRDTIKVWDRGGPYDMCHDSIIEANYTALGAVGDTIIVTLPKIDSAVNTWDVVGDYHTHDFTTCEEYKLSVVNDTVRGLISGYYIVYTCKDCIHTYSYDSFIVDFPTKSLSCQTWLGTNEISAPEHLSFYPTPFESSVSYATDLPNKIISITATDIMGQTVPVSVNGNAVSFPVQSASGVYIINTTFTDGSTVSNKVLKE